MVDNMSNPSSTAGFPVALVVIALMFVVFAASTQTTWLRLISLVGLGLVIAAAGYRLTRGTNHRG